MNTSHIAIRRFLVYIAVLLLTSCNPSSKYIFSPNEYSKKYSPLDSESLIKLEEIDSWKVMKEDVSLIRYNLLSNQLISVSEKNKLIVVLDIKTEKTISHNIQNVSDFRVLDIDIKGINLLGAMPSKHLSNGAGTPEYLQWIAIWDTNTGIQTYCVTDPCTNISNSDYKFTDIGASIDLDGNTIAVFGEDSYSTGQLSKNEASSITLVNSPDANYWWHIGNIAIDTLGNRLAIVFQEGRITLENINKIGFLPLNHIEILQKGDENQLEPIHAALFDRSGKWLAIVRENQLSIWDVGGWEKKEVFQEDIGTVRGISFNPSGKFLIIGTDNKIKIIGLEEKKMMAEFNTPDITSVVISEDNRLLFWGDKNGIVHLLGVLKSK